MTVGKFQTHDAKKFQFVYYCVCHWNDVKEVTTEQLNRERRSMAVRVLSQLLAFSPTRLSS